MKMLPTVREQAREDLQTLVEHGRRSRCNRAGVGQVRSCRRRVVAGSQRPERQGSWCRRRADRENPSRCRSGTSRSRQDAGLLGNGGAVEHEESSERRDEDDARRSRAARLGPPPIRRFNRSLSALRNTPNRTPANSRNRVEAAYQISGEQCDKGDDRAAAGGDLAPQGRGLGRVRASSWSRQRWISGPKPD